MKDLEFTLLGEKLVLSAEKALYWKREDLLVVSDIHLGKAGHFRKQGVPVPAHIHFKDLHRLSALIDRFGARRLIFLGDLFHSEWNMDWDYFCEWKDNYPLVNFELIRGNHDILFKTDYWSAGIEVIEELILEPFSFTHEKIASPHYNISGHIHPAVSLVGNARQTLKLPCFYFSKTHALMPAFGAFTGFVSIEPIKTDHIFVVAENSILKV